MTEIKSALYLHFDPGAADRDGFADQRWRGFTAPLLVADGSADEAPTAAKTGDRPAWLIGRNQEVCDFPVSPKLGFVSGIHCTIYYEAASDTWYLLNGGTYPDSKKRGKGGYAPSLNGIWLNGQKLEPFISNGRNVPDPTPINPQDLLWLGPGCKILIGGSLEDTVVPEVWTSEGWHAPSRPAPVIDPSLEKALQEQADKAKAAHQSPKQILSLMENATWPERFYYGALFLSAIATPMIVQRLLMALGGE